MRVLVISPGGMGSTALIEGLREAGLETNCPLDTDGLKHFPEPFDQRFLDFAPDRVIYVWGDPLLALCSLDRRGWLEGQRFKITGTHLPYLSLEILWQNTLIAGTDVYGLRYHRSNWEPQLVWPCFGFDWRFLAVDRPRLEEFLDLAIGALEGLNTREHSHYDLKAVPEEVKKIYARLDRGWNPHEESIVF